MNQTSPSPLNTAISAAKKAGQMLRDNFGKDQDVDEKKDFDIKLRLDVLCQEAIEKIIFKNHPDHALYGEEGTAGNQDSELRWVVDPIDGTVNYYYGIPHFCISIALQNKGITELGIIYEPMLDEMWIAEKGKGATLNGQPLTVSTRDSLRESIVTVGFSKSAESMEVGFARYKRIGNQVRKNRMMGSAALAMAYIASGRLDAYVEEQISLWDIAAGQLLIEEAGGRVSLLPRENEEYSILSSNGKIHGLLNKACDHIF